MEDEVLDAYLEGLVKIGNDQRVIKACEPNVAFPQQLAKWMVVRVLTARGLLDKELRKEGSKNVEA